jgi:hypothetical protein
MAKWNAPEVIIISIGVLKIMGISSDHIFKTYSMVI